MFSTLDLFRDLFLWYQIPNFICPSFFLIYTANPYVQTTLLKCSSQVRFFLMISVCRTRHKNFDMEKSDEKCGCWSHLNSSSHFFAFLQLSAMIASKPIPKAVVCLSLFHDSSYQIPRRGKTPGDGNESKRGKTNPFLTDYYRVNTWPIAHVR